MLAKTGSLRRVRAAIISRVGIVTAVGCLGLTLAASPAAAQLDFSGSAFNILAPGEYGAVPTTPNSTDQGQLYDALTPLQGNVTPADLNRYYLSEKFGVHRPGRAHARAPGVRVCRSCATATTSPTSTGARATT